jgi:hypothetical protein
MNYSICSLDEGGRTQHTQFGPYDNDAAALAQARVDLAESAIVEVWKGDHLLERLFLDPLSKEATS